MAFLSERGLPAFALLVGVFVALALGAWRRMRTARDADEGLVALTLLATLAAVAVVGAFDAVLLLGLPALLVWTALGALSRPEDLRPAPSAPAVRVAAVLLVALAAGAGAARSAAQLVAMSIYAEGGGRESLERAESRSVSDVDSSVNVRWVLMGRPSLGVRAPGRRARQPECLAHPSSRGTGPG